MTLADKFHAKFIYNRRLDTLCELIQTFIKKHGCTEILDVGAGDGKLDKMIMSVTPCEITGVDILIRENTFIPIEQYDGKHIDKEDGSIDAVMAVDVLHHTDDPTELFKELCRVSGKYIIIKDHTVHGPISYLKLRLMDYVGNKRFNVRLPYNYLTSTKWNQLFDENDLDVISYNSDLHLYKGLCHLLFDSNLQFIVLLKKRSKTWS